MKKFACIAALILLASPAQGAEQQDICNVQELIKAMGGIDGPLEGCRTGDIAHFQIDPKAVAYSSVVARYCSLDSTIIIEKHPTAPLGIVHIVCKYRWRWAKSGTRRAHPDKK